MDEPYTNRMTILATAGVTATSGTLRRYTLQVATEGEQVRAAQALRHKVFVDEVGATLRSLVPGDGRRRVRRVLRPPDHRATSQGEVVGTYRMLPPGRAPACTPRPSSTCAAWRRCAGALVETGRSCVHPDHRSGAVINLMWAGIARYMHLYGYRWLAGCASVPLADGGELAAGGVEAGAGQAPCAARRRVAPHRPWPVDAAPAPTRTAVPPLLRGYLRLGTWICGEPAHDPDFGVADFFVLLGSTGSTRAT